MILLSLLLSLGSVLLAQAAPITIGSKIFTENFLLAEIAAQELEPAHPVTRRFGLGSTAILFEALRAGTIDVYPDYTGTLAETLLKEPGRDTPAALREALAPLGLTVSEPVGFNNTYALAVREDFAQAHHLRNISDIAPLAPKINAAFSYEFMDRPDGFHGLARRYQLRFPPSRLKRMEHALVYQALAGRAVDLVEVYSTDANIEKFGLRVLKDDLHYFPAYRPVFVARLNFIERAPAAWAELQRLAGRVDEANMRRLNAAVDVNKKSFREAVAEFLGRARPPAEGTLAPLLLRTREHLSLVAVALLCSILLGVPLGIAATRFSRVGPAILLFCGLTQTIPSLALLSFLIPLTGVGAKPALLALCLYSLLPVVLNAYTGIRTIDPKHLENARALGLTRGQILRRVVLPLASPMLLAGVKTATIVSIGTATLAALVGAGGYGAPILAGLSMNDIPLILTGAVPAAGMAVVAQLLFALAERWLIPRGLRPSR